MGMEDRKTGPVRGRKTDNGPARRRLTKDDGKMAQYATLKSSAGLIIPEVKRVIMDRKKDESHSHRTSVIYPSEMARADWCPRATYYRMSGMPNPPSTSSFTLENVFAEGNSIHSKWQRWLSGTGNLWGDWKCRRCGAYVKDMLRPDDPSFGSCVGTGWTRLTSILEPPPLAHGYPHDWEYREVTLRSSSLPVSGHADGAMSNHNCLIEIKSVGLGTLRFEAPKLLEEHTYDVGGKKIIDIEGIWKNLHRPLPPHVKQGQIYLWMCREMGLPFDKMVFLYEFKANQQVKEFTVYPSEEILKPMLETSRSIVRCLTEGIIPDCLNGTRGCANCKAYEKAADSMAAAEEATWD